MRKLVLIDSNALVHRAFHALPPTLSSPKGVLTNAVYGFTSVLLKMLKDLAPDYIAATYDLAGPTFRHEEFADYKIHREKAPDELYAQIPLTKEVLRFFGIPIYEKQGFEADDLIGALAEMGKKEKNIQIIIVTGDLDTLQLVDSDKVVVFTLRKGLTDTVLYNEEEVKKRYGIKPEQVVDFKGLKGDPSDNIPGVPGIGEKTASILIQSFGSIENLYKRIEGISPHFPSWINGQIKKNTDTRFTSHAHREFEQPKKDRKEIRSPLSEKLIQKLQEYKDQAFFSKKLATIIRNVDVDFSLSNADWKKNMAKDDLIRLFKELGFYSLVKRLNELDLNESKDTQTNIEFKPAADMKNDLIVARTNKEIEAVLDKIARAKEIVFDILADGVFICSDNNKNYWSFGLGDLGVDKAGSDNLWNKFVAVFKNPEVLKTGHDLKPLLKKFLEKNIHVQGLYFDTKIAAYLLKPDRQDYDLPIMYRNEFGQDLAEGNEDRLESIIQLKNMFLDKLKEDGLLKVLDDIEMPLIQVLAEMELAGIKVDTNSLEKLGQSVNAKLSRLEDEIYGHAGIRFNINSPKQLKEILFERLGIKAKVRKTAKGALSTAAGELDKLSGEHPIIDLILKHRELQKLKTTYIEPFPQLIDKKSGRLYTTFNQTGTVTGRLSSQDPNLQNIPIRTELGLEFRKAFVSPPSFKLVSFDYSQLELRIAAHISGDKKMIEAFRRGEDIHTRTAAEIFEVDAKNVTPNMRREAKTLNFGLLYGMGLLGFQRAASVSRDRAKEFIDRYMREFAGVAKYMEEIKNRARKDGYVSTIYGRRRYLPEINSGIPQLVAQAERMAINHPIQGTEGDFLRIAMVRIFDLIHTNWNEDNVKMLIQVHDELLFEVKNNLVETTSPKIRNIMENVYQLDVPLVVDVKSGDNWRDLEEIKS